jgi:hypothetical protein
MSAPKNITELRDQLLDQFEALKNDPRRMLQTRELTNAAGKVIATLKCQLEYSLLKGEQPAIAFMGETSGKPLKSNARALLTA